MMSLQSRRAPVRTLLLGLILSAGGWCSKAAAQVPESILNEDPATLTAPLIPDRIEGINRFIFKFNDGLYKVTLRPLSRGYAAVVPVPVRRGIGNFFHNLGYPTRLVANILEGHPRGAWIETHRFLVNTIAGFGGFGAAADRDPKLRVAESDLGQAFATWGLGHGTYLVLPLLGPTSLRDGIGQGISGIYLSPTQYLPEWEERTGATVLDVTNQSPDTMQAYDGLRSASIDPYSALRNAFAARRAQQVRDQKAARIESRHAGKEARR